MSSDCIESSELRFQFSEVVGSRGTTKPPAQTCPLFGQRKMLECQLMGGILCDFRINIDIIRTESSTNLKKLLELQRKVLSSNDNVKQQYEKPIQVSNGAPLYLPHYTHRGSAQYICSWGGWGWKILPQDMVSDLEIGCNATQPINVYLPPPPQT